jgi:hypothetical protein
MILREGDLEKKVKLAKALAGIPPTRVKKAEARKGRGDGVH